MFWNSLSKWIRRLAALAAGRSGMYDTTCPFGSLFRTADALDAAIAETPSVPARTNIISKRR
jgi:hypothetical protein